MTPITLYRINSRYDSAENTDENDARNKRDAKRKSLKGPPVMLQTERKNNAKLLSEAMQLASHKSISQTKFDRNSLIAKRNSLDSFRDLTESGSAPKNNDNIVVEYESKIDSKSVTQFESKTDSNVECSIEHPLTDPVQHKETEPLTLSNLSKKLILIESSLSGLNSRSDPSVVLGHLENIASCLGNQEKISQLRSKEKNEAVINDFHREDIDCSLDFIEGYYEASSYGAHIKDKISKELNRIKEITDEIANFFTPSALSLAVAEAGSLQTNKISTPRSLDLKPVSSRANMTAQDIDGEKKRDDTLPLTTLRSI